MKICYIAKHGNGGNDEEGQIYEALTLLGHDVERYTERFTPYDDIPRVDSSWHLKKEFDLVLIHKLSISASLNLCQIRTKKKVFWNWDIVDMPPDDAIPNRDNARLDWMTVYESICDIGFYTDKEYMLKSRGACEKYILRQAANRKYLNSSRTPPIETKYVASMLCGEGGNKRTGFINTMKNQLGDKFNTFNGLYGYTQRDIIQSSNVVVCPDSPIKPGYWSNRLYIMAQWGGNILHPYVEGLEEEHPDIVKHIRLYKTRDELIELIKIASASFVTAPNRQLIQTMLNNTYLERCQELIATVSI